MGADDLGEHLLRRPGPDSASPPHPALAAAAAEAAAQLDARRLPWQAKPLEPSELEFFHRHGYLVIRNCATPHQVERVKRSCWAQLSMSPDDPDGWYTQQGSAPTPFHHFLGFGCPAGESLASDDAAAWEIAQNPRVHSAFASLYGTPKLFASVGQGTFKPPWKHDLPKIEHICHAGVRPWFGLGDALPMHWDYDMSLFESGSRLRERSAVELQSNLFLCAVSPPPWLMIHGLS